MQFAEVPFTMAEDDIIASGGDRSEGLHQSDIIKDICRTLDPKRFGSEAAEELPWDLFVLGFAWERVLGRAFSELSRVNMHPGEFNLDGITGSPDGYNPDWDCLEEYKATYMSSRNVVDLGHDKFWHWRVQAMGYMKMTGWKQCIFRVYFVCGDYSYPIGPQWRSWVMVPTEQEIDKNWNMLVKHAKKKGWLP